MRFADSFLDDIRARVPISQVIGARVQFDAKKSNPARGDYWACCPFHGEKTPSFHCDDARGNYHCFGCGVGGDIFRFAMQMDGLSFHEAVERMAERAGVPMPKPDAAAEIKEKQRDTLYDIMEKAAVFYENALQAETEDAANARAYLRERGLSPPLQKQFRLGLAPRGNTALKQFFTGEGVDKKLQEQSGLFSESREDGNLYDRFRHRIMFPIADIRGKIIAFGGRALSAQDKAKYLNSPETELFHKGRQLYNLARARAAMRGINGEPDKPLLVVEGYIDVTALAQAGIGAVVAPLGTALTEEQLALLWRFCPQPVLCFDGDKAGMQAAYRALDRALPLLRAGVSLHFALLPDGQDPDDMVRTQGRAAFEEIVAQALPPADLLWRRAAAGQSFTTPESRAALEKYLFDTVALIKDSSLRYYYRRDIKQRLWEHFAPQKKAKYEQYARQAGGQRQVGSRFGDNGGFAVSGKDLVTKSLSDSRLVRSAQRSRAHLRGFGPREAAILALLAEYPLLWNGNFDVLSELEWQNPKLKELHGAMLEVLAERAALSAGGGDSELANVTEAANAENITELWRERLEQKGQKSILREIMTFAANAGILRGDKKDMAQAQESLSQALSLSRRARSLHKQIREIESDIVATGDRAALDRLSALREELCRSDIYALPASADEI